MAAELRKELSGVDRNHQHQRFARALRSNVPLVGNPQRIVIDVFGAGALNRGDEKFNTGSLLQVSENCLKSLFRGPIDRFSKVINVPNGLWQLGVLCLAAPVRTRPNQ